MVFLAIMNLQARIDRYKERGFQQLEAEILVLMEESAAALFGSFPDHFILFGGATLVLFYESPRLSRDLDLLASPSQIPRPEEIQAAVRSGIQPIAEALGLGQLEFRKDIDGPDFVKQWVIANEKPLFSIDLTRIGGTVLETQVVKKAIASAPEKIVATPSANYLLFQKCETFLGRRHAESQGRLRYPSPTHAWSAAGQQSSSTPRGLHHNEGDRKRKHRNSDSKHRCQTLHSRAPPSFTTSRF